MSNSVNRYFEGLLVGGTLGFIVGLLTAPKRGAELRKELSDGAEDIYGHLNEQFADISGVVSDKVQPFADKAIVFKDRAVIKASDISSKVSSKASVIKEKVSERAHDLSDKAADMKGRAMELKEKVSETAHDLSDRAAVMKDRAMELKEKVVEQANTLKDKVTTEANELKESFDASGSSTTTLEGQALLDNYTGNNSGPMYTPGAKANPNTGASSMPDAGGTYTGNRPEAAGG